MKLSAKISSSILEHLLRNLQHKLCTLYFLLVCFFVQYVSGITSIHVMVLNC